MSLAGKGEPGQLVASHAGDQHVGIQCVANAVKIWSVAVWSVVIVLSFPRSHLLRVTSLKPLPEATTRPCHPRTGDIRGCPCHLPYLRNCRAASPVTGSRVPDQPTSSHCSGFLLIDLQMLCNEKTLDGLTAGPNMTIGIELRFHKQNRHKSWSGWLTRDRRIHKQQHKEITPGLFLMIAMWGSPRYGEGWCPWRK